MTDPQLRQLLLEKYEPIAIVGAGLRFPGDNDSLTGFTEFLTNGESGIVPIPEDRWEDQKGLVRTTSGGFLNGIDQFDAKFFGISPKEANFVDPQQRLVMETAWAALENANIDPTGLRHGDGGVFMGIGSMDYLLELEALRREDIDGFLGTGTAHSAVSGRLSYFLGWRGPCVSVDTACSSSLVALHQAVQALRRRECSIALAGGVNAVHHPVTTIVFSTANMLAPDGRCKTFDDSADGYSRAEGCGVLVLKRLTDARKDGDRILALVRGSAVRQDGESAGLTVPNGASQEAVMRAALVNAAIEPRDISYVEAHGTGTPLGDPIEMGSINEVFAATHRENRLVVGSVKTNLGHLEIAAGVAGVIKTVLQMREGRIFPHINFAKPSGRIPWDRYPITVPTENLPWSGRPKRAIVNSFGFTGTISTVVLEEAPALPTVDTQDEGAQVFAVSAKSKAALREQLANIGKCLSDPGPSLSQVCRSAALGRAHFPHRVAAVVRTRADLAALLADDPCEASRDLRKVAFLFTGQGAQHAGMGESLRRFPVFAEHYDACAELFGLNLRELTAEQVNETRYTQPALFAVEYAAAKLWLSWGVRPSVLIGHSIGEIAAAAVAGLFTLPDAVKLVAARASAMQAVTTPGGMLAITAHADKVRPLLAGYPDLSLAAINAPEQCVVSGGVDSLAKLAAEIPFPAKQLTVSHAFHSPLMRSAAEEFRAAIAGMTFGEPEFTLISNLTGRVARPSELSNVDYWVRHLLEPVDFAAGMAAVAKRGQHAFIELGPTPALTGLGRRCLDDPANLWLHSMHPRDDDAILTAVARLYSAGLPFGWQGFYSTQPSRPVELPTYPFERRRYWLPLNGSGFTGGGPARHPLLGTSVPREDGVREFMSKVDVEQPAYLADHVAMGQVLFPAAGYLETILALQEAVFGETNRPIEELEIHEPLIPPAELRTRLHPDHSVEIVTRSASGERRLATARIGTGLVTVDGLPDLAVHDSASTSEAAVLSVALPADERLDAEDIYADFAALGMAYGPAFRRLREITRDGDIAVGEVSSVDTPPLEHLPPSILDSAMQTAIALAGDDGARLPVRVEACQLLKKPMGTSLRSVMRTRDADSANLVLLEGDRPIFVMRGLGYQRVESRAGLFHQPRWVRKRLGSIGTAPVQMVVIGQAPALAATDGVTCVDTVAEAIDLLRANPSDVTWLWRSSPQPAYVDELRAECEHNFSELLKLIPALAPGKRLWLVTEEAQPLAVTSNADTAADDAMLVPDPALANASPESTAPVGPRSGGDVLGGTTAASGGDVLGGATAAAALLGFARTVATEIPASKATLVDIGIGEHAALVDEWRTPTDDRQIAYRAGQRFVRRLFPHYEGNVELIPRDRVVEQVRTATVPPTGDEIQVQVRAAGLNYKDAADVSGFFGEHHPIGYEAAGVVTAAGPQATFAVGDRVVLSNERLMRRSATLSSQWAAKLPSNLDFTVAAGQPTAYLNAYHALHDLAGIKAGDRVLIHSAAGGVGQAAVQLALHAGAHVIGTASPEKHGFLRERGVHEVLPSRQAAYDVTVDIVLSGLGGDPAGLDCLAPNGRFIQLGRTDIWTAEQVHAVRPDVDYHAFYFSETPADQLGLLVGRLLPEVMRLLESGVVLPVPVTAYAPEEIDEAVEQIVRGHTIGKSVIEFSIPDSPIRISPDETYLVTGGLGGLGLAVAGKLAQLGAKHLVLVGRNATAAPEIPGVTVEVVAADISDPADVARLAQRQIHGIVHAAGVLADAPLNRQTWEGVDKVFGAKVYGTWLLHKAFPRLNFFVGYSSIVSLFGPPAQANYAAANSYLDAVLAGRPDGISVNWGPWGEVGMAAGLGPAWVRSTEAQGVKVLPSATLLRGLTRVLAKPVRQVLIGEFDFGRIATSGDAFYAPVAPLAVAVRQLDLDELRAKPQQERRGAIDLFIRSTIADVLQFDGPDEIDSQTEFVALGMDSLAAVAVKNNLELAFGLTLPLSATFDYPSVRQLAEHLDKELAS